MSTGYRSLSTGPQCKSVNLYMNILRIYNVYKILIEGYPFKGGWIWVSVLTINYLFLNQINLVTHKWASGFQKVIITALHKLFCALVTKISFTIRCIREWSNWSTQELMPFMLDNTPVPLHFPVRLRLKIPPVKLFQLYYGWNLWFSSFNKCEVVGQKS